MDYVHVTGKIDENGKFTPGWWSTIAAPAVGAAEGEARSYTGWAAVALNDAGEILARTPASVVPICPVETRLDLSALLALPDAVSAVAVLHADREMFRRAVPAPSRASLDKSLGTRLARKLFEVPVHIDGPDPGPGAYMVPRWEAPRHPPLPLGLIDVGVGQPAIVRLDLTELPGGEGCRLSVSYHDGIRTVTAFSKPLSIPLRPAVPVIVAPTPRLALFDDSWLTLEGRLDGDGDPEAMEWLLGDELVGTGTRAGAARPHAGTRTVTLKYETARVSVKIEVLPAPTEEVQPPRWTPPWRSGPFRSTSGSSNAAKGSKKAE
jgi:hypothetical protein